MFLGTELLDLLPPGGYPKKYDDHVKNEKQASTHLQSTGSDTVYYQETVNGRDYLSASVKMPSNEIKSYQFVQINKEMHVVEGNTNKKIKSIDDFLEKKIFEDKMQMFSNALGKDNPQEALFIHNPHTKYRNANAYSMADIKGHLSIEFNEHLLKGFDFNAPYPTGSFLFSQPKDPSKKNTHLDVSIKSADSVGHITLEFKNGGIYPEGKIDAANQITNLAAYIQNFANNAAQYIDQLNSLKQQMQEKMKKNLSKSQEPHYNAIEFNIAQLKKDIANGKIKDKETFDKQINKYIKPSLLKIAHRSPDYQKHKADVFSKIKDVFRGKAERRADTILKNMDETQKTPDIAPQTPKRK